MKIDNDFVLQDLVGEYIAVPIGDAGNRLHGIIRLNESSAFLWNKLIKGVSSVDELENALSEEYSIDSERSKCDVDAFLTELNRYKCLV